MCAVMLNVIPHSLLQPDLLNFKKGWMTKLYEDGLVSHCDTEKHKHVLPNPPGLPIPDCFYASYVWSSYY